MTIEQFKMTLPNVFAYELGLRDALQITECNKITVAGPCTIESEEMLFNTAQIVKSLNIPILRGGAFKNRTSPYSFQGLEEFGLDIHVRVGRELGLKIVSEIIDGSQIGLFKNVDIIQIGARGMKNYVLMKELVKLNKPIILKRDMNSTLYEFLSAAEKLLYYGQKRLVLCERGVSAKDDLYKYILDLNIVAWLKQYTNIPVIVDPSHAAGVAELVQPLSLAAISVGADGLMIEAHCSPLDAMCDKEQAISLKHLKAISSTLNHLKHESEVY